MTASLAETLKGLETALARRPADTAALLRGFRGLVVPADVTDAELTRLYHACYRLLGIGDDDAPLVLADDVSEREAGFLTAVAQDVLESTLYDAVARNRAWVAESIAWHRARGRPVPEGLDDSQLPPRLEIPWDEATAEARIRPFLDRFAAGLTSAPAGHFPLCWNVARDGYPVFQPIFRRWLELLEAHGVGVPGTAMAIPQAIDLYDRSDPPVPISWADCARDVVPLLDHPHPMLAAGAARYLGALYADGYFDADADAPGLAAWVERLQRNGSHRAAVCGAFVCGFDRDCDGLDALAARVAQVQPGFDLDQWVLGAFAPGPEQAYLPNAQALWFYVHEHYCTDPDFVTRLIDRNLAWVAMMCATELRQPVAGMEAVLQRLAANPDTQVSRPAQSHLDRYYRAGS